MKLSKVIAVPAAPTPGTSPYFTAMTLTDSSGNKDTYAAGSNGGLNNVSDALTIADEGSGAPAALSGTDCGDGVYAGPNTSCSFAAVVPVAGAAAETRTRRIGPQ